VKALSIPVAVLILLIISVAILIPAFILLNELGFFSSQGRIQGSLYVQQQEQQLNQIYKGNPNIYYNSSKSPYLEFSYNLIPTPLNITGIYYFNGTMWVAVLQQSLIVSGNFKYPLPPSAFNKPIIIITALGNIYYLNPNTSVVTVTVAGPAGKVPVYITAFVINGSKLLPASILVTINSTTSVIGSALTPQIFYLNPGTYLLNNKNGSLIFLSGYGLTASFLNWSIVGGGTLSAPNKLSTQFVVYGPLIITAIYNASIKKFPVTIMPNNIPLGNTIVTGSTTLVSLNSTIPVFVDNKLYIIGSSGITLNLTYGYHIVQFPSAYNITFDYKDSQGNRVFNMPAGQINTYTFTGLSSNTNKITVLTSYQIFVNGSGTIYGNYNLAQTYYLIVVYNNFTLPPEYTIVSNTSPILGNIAGQLLQLNNTYTWGPQKDYVPFKIYVKAGSKYTITYDYLSGVEGTFVLKKGSDTYTYYGLLSYPRYITINCPPSIHANYCGTKYLQENKPPIPNISFTVNSPLIIINGQRWVYGGTSYA